MMSVGKRSRTRLAKRKDNMTIMAADNWEVKGREREDVCYSAL
jgi:hypothetical protein